MVNILFGILFTFIGIFIIAVFIRMFALRVKIIKNGQRISAKIVSIKIKFGHQGHKVYYPVLTYTVDGMKQIVTYQQGTIRRKKYKKLQHLEIIYNKDNPKEIVIARDIEGIIISVFTILIGLFAFWLGIMLFFA